MSKSLTSHHLCLLFVLFKERRHLDQNRLLKWTQENLDLQLMLKDTVLLFLDQTLGIIITNSDSMVLNEMPVMCQASHFADRRSLPLSMRRKRRRPGLLGPAQGPTRHCLSCFFLPAPSCLRENIRPHKKLHNSPTFPEPGSTQVRLTPKQDLFTAWL